MDRHWVYGAGRIKREAYILHVGEKELDVDDLRRYVLPQEFVDAIRAIQLLNMDEREWLETFLAEYPITTREDFWSRLNSSQELQHE